MQKGRAIPKRESCTLGKIFSKDIDGNGTLTAKWCFGVEGNSIGGE
jgi:hypothetical protein